MRTVMVIRLQGGSEKDHAKKAMKVAAEAEGVESVALSGKDKSLMRVVGDGVDCNDLTTRLRRKVGRADLVELRTLHGGASGGDLLSRDGAYGSGGYGAGGGYPSYYAPGYYYGQQQPSFQYYQYPQAPYAMHHEYYTTANNDPNGCCIM